MAAAVGFARPRDPRFRRLARDGQRSGETTGIKTITTKGDKSTTSRNIDENQAPREEHHEECHDHREMWPLNLPRGASVTSSARPYSLELSNIGRAFAPLELRRAFFSAAVAQGSKPGAFVCPSAGPQLAHRCQNVPRGRLLLQRAAVDEADFLHHPDPAGLLLFARHDDPKRAREFFERLAVAVSASMITRSVKLGSSSGSAKITRYSSVASTTRKARIHSPRNASPRGTLSLSNSDAERDSGIVILVSPVIGRIHFGAGKLHQVARASVAVSCHPGRATRRPLRARPLRPLVPTRRARRQRATIAAARFRREID